MWSRRGALRGEIGHVAENRDGELGVRTTTVRFPGGNRTASRTEGYRYWPVFVAVSIARPDSFPLPLMSVRM
jgi:hypothetical protein